MKTIWKIALDDGGIVAELPEGAQLLSAHAQDDTPTVWFLADPAAPLRRYGFYVALTGESPLPACCVPDKFLGTVLCAGGAYVLHVFGAWEAEEVET